MALNCEFECVTNPRGDFTDKNEEVLEEILSEVILQVKMKKF